MKKNWPLRTCPAKDARQLDTTQQGLLGDNGSTVPPPQACSMAPIPHRYVKGILKGRPLFHITANGLWNFECPASKQAATRLPQRPFYSLIQLLVMKKANILPWLAAIAVIVSVMVLASKLHMRYAPAAQRTNAPIDTNIARHKAPPLFADAVTTPAELAAEGVFRNLKVYILKGKAANARQYVTLQQALKNKWVRIRETGDVSALKIDNISASYVYVNSGDIVKGGRQDRTIPYDVIIPPNVRDIDVESFCVERGRWSKRESENDLMFSESNKSLSSKELKIAAKHNKSQSQVWHEVEKYQDKTNESIRATSSNSATVEVRSQVSASSLQLTLDNERLKRSGSEYKKVLEPALKNVADATGMAVVINGKLYSIDLFNNHQLFTDLFDKLLDAAIAAAISESAEKQTETPAIHFDEILHAAASVYEDFDVNRITRFQSAEPNNLPDLIIFTSFDKPTKTWLHRNWLDNSHEQHSY